MKNKILKFRGVVGPRPLNDNRDKLNFGTLLNIGIKELIFKVSAN